MSETHGFIDLRIGHGARGIGDDSVWPSFTDIMTVIVMIFLMALVVIMVRNFELDRELISTTTTKDVTIEANQGLVRRLTQIESALLDSKSEKDILETNLSVALKRLSALLLAQKSLTTDMEKVISERGQLQQANTLLEQQKETAQSEISTLTKSEQALSQQLQQTNILLEQQKEAAQSEISTLTKSEQALSQQLQQANALLEQQKDAAQSKISTLTKSEQTLSRQLEELIVQLSTLKLKSSEQIASLTEDKQSLSAILDAISAQLAEVKLFLQKSRSKNVTLTQEATELKTSGRVASEEIVALMALIEQRGKENEALLAQATTSSRQFSSLREEYEALDAKYHDLIRPARNIAGKQVATVWIKKSATGLQYKMTQPGQSEPRAVEQQQMYQTLQALKAKFGNLLYVRVVIPKESGLSYDEAANATQEILQNYDYYSQ